MRWRKEKIGSNKASRGALYNIADVVLNVVIIVAIVGVVRTFVVSPFEVKGSSMVPTLENNQYIIINKFGYLLGYTFGFDSYLPKRGDVVVFHPPGDDGKYYVKRIIGLPKDEIIIRDGRVYILSDGKEEQLDELYLDDRNTDRTFRSPVGKGDQSEEKYIIPEGEYFLLGDNRRGSLDSRSFKNDSGDPAPFVPKENISGRVWFVVLPITKSHALEAPEYGVGS